MKFLVVEGVDGSGKSTQLRLIMDYLAQKDIAYRYLHFPRTDSRVYGEMIARFLRGDFGSIHAVDPYLVALLYAGDRMDASRMIREWIQDGYLVLLDRYVYSNIAFQCAKLPQQEQKEKLRDWILELEYGYNQIPRPDLNILLDVPFSFTQKKLTETRVGSERDYLRGQRDIHEEDLDFQQRVREMYLWQARTFSDLSIISCNDNLGSMLAPEAIFSRIIQEIQL
jgi:dTMP kinase